MFYTCNTSEAKEDEGVVKRFNTSERELQKQKSQQEYKKL